MGLFVVLRSEAPDSGLGGICFMYGLSETIVYKRVFEVDMSLQV
jgi:hypothetical protein